MEEKRTIKELIRYLETLDQDKTINATYLDCLFGWIKEEKTRPFIWEDLIKESNGSYIIKPLYY